jgi:L-fuconolactonase
MDRRQFLTAGVAAASAGLLRAELKEAAVFPIIDTHQHLWDLSKFRLPWHHNVLALAKSFLPDDYARATADLGTFPTKDWGLVPGKVVKSIYMEVDVDPAQQTAEAEYVIDLCQKGNTPTAAAVISGRPASDGFHKYVAQFKSNPYIKGIRQVLHVAETPAGYCLDQRFVRGIRLLGELGLSFDLCMRPGELADAAKLIDACPGTRFILDHCGNGDVQAEDRSGWQKDMAALARRQNVVCKVSGIVVAARPGRWTADDLAPVVNHTVEVFGKDRVMFGGDWPVCTLTSTYAQWVAALKTVVAGWSDEDRRKLFHDNAARFYGLK